MDTIITCIIITVVLPYIAKLPLALAMHRAGGYDNRNPREQQAALTGFGSRARAAHENSFEALLIFAVAALLSIATDNVTPVTTLCSVIFVAARIGYLVCYWLNWDKLRTLIWTLGFAAVLVMLGQTLI